MDYIDKDNETVPEEAILNYTYSEMLEIETIEGRRLSINGEITEEILNSLSFHIMRYNRQDIGIPIEEREPIIVYVNTPGGNLEDGFGIIDLIMSSKTPVYTVNQASCYSMGILIFLAGEKRYSMKNSTYLLHDGSMMVMDSISKTKDRVDFVSGQMTERIKKYVLDRTNISENQYDNSLRKEWYFYPEEGKQLGVVTHIVGTDCDFDEII